MTHFKRTTLILFIFVISQSNISQYYNIISNLFTIHNFLPILALTVHGVEMLTLFLSNILIPIGLLSSRLC